MSEIFNDKTTAEIDAKLHRDILKHNLNIEKISIGLVILLMILFRGWIFYWLKFGVAVPTNLSNKSISILQEPIMEAYSPSVQRGKSFKYSSLIKPALALSFGINIFISLSLSSKFTIFALF